MATATNILSAPTGVTLMVTRRCNLHCLYCCSAPEQFLREDMSTEKLLSVIDELTAGKVFKFALTGGEPFVHPDLLVLAHAILRHPTRLLINTNATLITEKVIAGLRKLPRAPAFSVSVDGFTADTYARVRGGDALDDMKRGITMLTGAGFTVQTFVVLCRLNYRELPKIVEFAKSVRSWCMRVSLPLPCGRLPEHAAETAMTPQELREALEMTLRVEEDNPGFLSGPWMSKVHFYREVKEGRQSPAASGNRPEFNNCGGGRRDITIACDGTVVPCELVYTYRAGNVCDQPFLEIWRNSPMLRKLRECHRMPLTQVHGCEECAWHHSCRGPCPADGYALTGIWPSTGPVCMTKQIGELFEREPPAGVCAGYSRQGALR